MPTILLFADGAHWRKISHEAGSYSRTAKVGELTSGARKQRMAVAAQLTEFESAAGFTAPGAVGPARKLRIQFIAWIVFPGDLVVAALPDGRY